MIDVEAGISDKNLSDIYSDKTIQVIGFDHYPAAPVIHPMAQYLSAYINGKFVGAFLILMESRYEFIIHALLKRSAILKSRDLLEKAIGWVFNHKTVLRLTAYIIEGFDKVVNLCLKMGFKHEGARRNALLKNGIPHDIIIMGMTRQEWLRL